MTRRGIGIAFMEGLTTLQTFPNRREALVKARQITGSSSGHPYGYWKAATVRVLDPGGAPLWIAGKPVWIIKVRQTGLSKADAEYQGEDYDRYLRVDGYVI